MGRQDASCALQCCIFCYPIHIFCTFFEQSKQLDDMQRRPLSVQRQERSEAAYTHLHPTKSVSGRSQVNSEEKDLRVSRSLARHGPHKTL